MNQELINIRTMIGCNASQFNEIINKSVGNITMSSGSWYAPFTLYDNDGILAKYESNGTLIFSR
jgi:hypothetical protein